MTAWPPELQFRQPTIKRLGFDDGWWHFKSHFLNLGFPTLLIDACLLPNSTVLNLSLFSECPPDSRWPTTELMIKIFGSGASLHVAGSNELVAWHWFRCKELNPAPSSGSTIGIFVGDSHSLELSWSALWTFRVGLVTPVHSLNACFALSRSE